MASFASFEKSKMASSIMKNIVAPPLRFKFPVKLICCIALDQHEALVVYLNLLLSSYNDL